MRPVGVDEAREGALPSWVVGQATSEIPSDNQFLPTTQPEIRQSSLTVRQPTLEHLKLPG